MSSSGLESRMSEYRYRRPRQVFSETTTAAGSYPSSRRSSMSLASVRSGGTSLGSMLNTNLNLNRRVAGVGRVFPFNDIMDTTAAQENKLARLEYERRRYIQQLKKQIQTGPARPQLLEDLPVKPRIYNSLETRQDKIVNQLYLFPDTDPAVYTRKIETPSVFTHEPVFGF